MDNNNKTAKTQPNPLESFKRNDSLFNKYSDMLKNTEQDQYYTAKLIEIGTIDTFGESDANLLASLYQHEDSDYVRLATILNSAITQGNTVFMLTVAAFNHLSVKDPHHSLKQIDGNYYRKMISKALGRGWIAMLRPAIIGGQGKKGKGAIYEIVHPILVESLIKRKGMAQHLAEKDFILNWYAGVEVETVAEHILTEVDLEQHKKWKEKADVIFKRK